MASAKPRPGKISPKNLMPRQKGAQKPNDWASFHEPQSAKIEIFQLVGHLFHSFIKCYTFLPKIVKNLMPGQTLTPEKPNAWAHTSIPIFIRELPPPPSQIMLRIAVIQD